MNEEHQHFVPKSYLRNFCVDDTEKLNRAKFVQQKNKWLSSSQKNINQICYGKDYYDVLKEIAEGNEIDVDHLERKAFWYEKSYLKDLIEGVINRSFNADQIDSIARFYLSMKARNPQFRNALDEKKIEEIINEEIEAIEKKLNSEFEKLPSQTIFNLLKNQIQIARSKLLNQNTKAMIHNTTLLNHHFGRSGAFESLVQKVTKYKKVFIKISSPNDFFITSNSPGFSVDLSNKVSAFKFENDVAHYMPISSKIALALMNPAIFFENPDLAIVDAPKKLVSFINIYTLISNKNEIYCSDNGTLLELINANNDGYSSVGTNTPKKRPSKT